MFGRVKFFRDYLLLLLRKKRFRKSSVRGQVMVEYALTAGFMALISYWVMLTLLPRLLPELYNWAFFNAMMNPGWLWQMRQTLFPDLPDDWQWVGG